MTYTYPAPPARVAGDLTTIEVHHLMKTPALLRKRVLELSAMRYIADYLLPGRFEAVGGAILYETGEEILPADKAEAIKPGGEYPRTVLTAGQLAAAKTVKWGLDSPVTDEAISRLGIDPVNRALRKLVNGNIRDVDGVALATIASTVTQSVSVTAAGTNPINAGAWSTAENIVKGILGVKAKLDEVNVGRGFDFNTIVLKPSQFAKVVALLVTSGYVPREAQQNAILTGVIPDYLGMTWTTSPFTAVSDPMIVDRDQLGGMGDEGIQSPGYTGMDGVQVKSIRNDLLDAYMVRARRVTVPVILEPLAGAKIVNTGL